MVLSSAVITGEYSLYSELIFSPILMGTKGTGFLMASIAKSQIPIFFSMELIISAFIFLSFCMRVYCRAVHDVRAEHRPGGNNSPAGTAEPT